MEPILIKAGGLPEDPREQAAILGEIRRAFLGQDFKRLHDFVSACKADPEALGTRENFYLALARRLHRFLRIMPPLADCLITPWLRFLAEDLRWSDREPLQAAGKKLQGRRQGDGETQPAEPGQFRAGQAGPISPLPDGREELPELIGFLEENWSFDPLLDRALALVAEIYSLPEDEREAAGLRWLRDAGLLEELAADGLTDTARVLPTGGELVASSRKSAMFRSKK